MKSKALFFILTFYLFTPPIGTHAFPEIHYIDDDQKTKSQFILSITKYLQWSTPTESIVLGIISNNDEMYKTLSALASSRSSGKKIIIKNYTDVSEIEDCNILFVTKGGELSVNEIRQLDITNLLVITEQEGEKDSAINLINKEGKLMFEVNREVVGKTGVKMASKLMDLAIVK
ncbi:YfiR family protein [Fulvivirga sediminis]|uniref:YfiR family protein n=1 Tax=Fulvivirga sediminis TaxID=2803949 RepID=A0A937FD04_9BACT|nr:YfiR family protein [Fulvivirga sediminis]MBL3658650.1 YfiR family protein [Fulvivirga sediminis]